VRLINIAAAVGTHRTALDYAKVAENTLRESHFSKLSVPSFQSSLVVGFTLDDFEGQI
jgi:hypothetical protein